MATINVSFGNDKLQKVARGLNRRRFEDEQPSTVAEGEAFVKSEVIEFLKTAFRRGDLSVHEDTFVPEDDIAPS